VRPLPRLALAVALIAAPIAALLALATAAAATPAGLTSASAARAHTRLAVVRPVHADGRPVAGYTVKHETIPGFTCLDASTVAVDRNIDFCGFSATYTMACWKSVKHTALCLRDPWSKTLVRIRYSGKFVGHAAVHHPVPQAMRLKNGNHCWVRDGGAWGSVPGHPSWTGAYSCDQGAIYGPGDGINQHVQPWLVHVLAADGKHVTDHRVAKAIFVGTAA
jgi:hypothetical protein